MSSLEGRVRREVEDLHAFFESWLGGVCEQTAEVFERLERALGPHFEMVVPSGAELNRSQLVESLFGAHGKQPGLMIRVENCRVVWEDAGKGACLARYEEVQSTGSSEPATRRVSTVLLCEGGRDGELTWLHVHETWSQAG